MIGFNSAVSRVCSWAQNGKTGRILEALADHTMHPVDAGGFWGRVLEEAADRLVPTNRESAAWLYDQAAEQLQIYASGASGQGDGRSRMADVNAVREKRAALER